VSGGASPVAVFGLPLRNGEDHLAEALESLLDQSRRDLAIVVVDDASTDGSAQIARRYAAVDARITYERREPAIGLVRNWRRAYDAAGERFPDAAYFAWASDHDVWHPQWLEVLAAELDAHPEAVLAYPAGVRIDDTGAEYPTRPRPFDTAGMTVASERFRRTGRAMTGTGDMIYGLARRDALERCGPFPLVVLADRLHLVRLSLEGEFRQVPRRLWSRRFREGVVMSEDRQRRASFPAGVPVRARVPWWLAHPVLLARGRGRPGDRLSLGAVALVDSIHLARARRHERVQRRRRWKRRERRLRYRSLARAALGRIGVARARPPTHERARTAVTGPGRAAAPASPSNLDADRVYEAVRAGLVEPGAPRLEGLAAAAPHATPAFVAEIRRHARSIGGADPAAYRPGSESRDRHARKLDALHGLGRRDLLVPEPPFLGGFGFEIGGALVNADTLRFYEALIALDRAELLPALEGEGRLAVEIGARWGGFTYQLKTLFPRLRLVVVDRPERFLFSAVYLRTAFPDARFAFWSDDGGRLEAADVDFVFVPLDRFGSLELDRVDLALGIGSLGELAAAELESCIGRLRELGAQWLYCLDRAELRESLDPGYWLRDVWILPVAPDEWLDEAGGGRKPDPLAGLVPPRPGRLHHLACRARLLPARTTAPAEPVARMAR
jgi:glycosyltransferase involved in cell wall biosynthesis